jgi:hypothetical protein
MTDTIESLRARIAEVERERDEARAAAVVVEATGDELIRAARDDAARLAEALRRERNVIAEWHPDAEDPASMVLVRIDEALAAHDAGTPADDPRDAEIASLRAALAAGPAALREFGDAEMTARTAAAHVEAAQKKAMGET